MDPRLAWTTPRTAYGVRHASWNGGRPFASLDSMSPRLGNWTLCFYPSHHTGAGKNYFAATEAQAKRWVARWAQHHWRVIGRPPPPKQTS